MRRIPIVTILLVAANLAAFGLVNMSLGGNGGTDVFQRYTLVPSDVAVQPERLVTSGFLHVGVEHLGLNMITLAVAGSQVERMLGPARFALLYAAGLLGGSAAVLLLSDPLTPTVGASGAIFAVLAAQVVLDLGDGLRYGGFVLLAVNLGASFAMTGISWPGHLGGAIVGLAIGGLFASARRRRARREQPETLGIRDDTDQYSDRFR